MAGFDAYLKAFAAIACIAFAWVVLAGGRRRGAPLFLATFLLLIAGNQAAETMRALLADDAARLFWFRVASIFAALDPLALYLFACESVRDPVRDWPKRLVAGGAILLCAAALALGTTDDLDRQISLARMIFTAAVYAAVLFRFLGAMAREPADPRTRVLFTAVAIATVLPWVQIPYEIGNMIQTDLLGLRRTDPLYGMHAIGGALSWPIVAALCAAVVARTWRAHGRALGRHVAVGLAIGYGVATLLNLASLSTAPNWGFTYEPEPPWYGGLAILGRASAALRWIAFGGLVSAAILRDDLLGLSLARRRTAARALVALAIVGALGLMYAALAILFGEASVQLRPIEWILVALLLLATQGFRPLIDRVAERVYGVPMPADRTAALEAYRRAVEQAAAEGRDLHEDAELARLRRELDLAPTEARVLERLAGASAAGPLVAGQHVGGRYLVRRLIGRGGAGRVFLARDDTLSRDIVLKEVVHDDPDDENALREARAAGGLNHPNVVVVHDVIRRGASSLLVVEYVPGGSLTDRIAERGPLPASEGLPILDAVLAGLEAVHAQGLVHRDLKPDNVLLTREGHPKIADFGIARSRRGVTARFDEPDAFIGTPEFMAPEQRAGARATAQTDVFAVGRLARSCIRGPLPASVEAVVARALEVDPARRWQSAREMRAALREASARVTPGT